MNILTKVKDWISWPFDYLVMKCHPIWLMLIVVAGFLSAMYILYKTVGLPNFLPEGYVYKVMYKDWVFYTDYVTHETHSSVIEFKDIRTGDRIQIGSDYIITQIPQEHARDTTY